MQSSLLALWNEIPPYVRIRLLVGSTGSTQLIDVAETALRAASESMESGNANMTKTLLHLTRSAMVDAWTESPANLGLANQLVAVGARVAAVVGEDKSPLLHVLSRCGTRYDVDVDTRYYLRTLQKNDTEKAGQYCSTQFGKSGNYFWLDKVHELALQDHRPDVLDAFLQQHDEVLHRPVSTLLHAEAAYLAHDYARAESIYRTIENDPVLAECTPAFLPRRAEMQYRQGHRGDCLAFLRQALQRRPLTAHLTYRLFDLLSETDTAITVPSGRTAVLLYTYNKAEVLEKTLESLCGTDLPGVRLVVLDNASTDGTKDVLAKYAALLPSFQVVTLPVNIGAPAARNWLMALPEVQECDHIAYLDDDVLLPSDWLGRLYAGFDRYPEAGVIGARIADAVSPDALQAVGFHLLASLYPASGNIPLDDPLFDLAAIHSQSADSGQFRLMSPCTSVMGCCHLFKTETLNTVGPFDIRFNPTQFDDVDHDLRLSLQGRSPVYQGHLRVEHMSTLQGNRFVSGSKLGNSAANKHKLQTKYSLKELTQLATFQYETIESDFFEKLRHVVAAECMDG
ncbi:glycosyltransferase family 2 protein [Desulfovibrio inopinatus]|uniref:glycosyltransferase family 2 protein n=1 Tax=Desulfovibrio inopinatus TaxID=102109 RepID=UPI00041EB3B4|nr:glycosyltransferase family A protein [Desulfovibrio inopinatus]